MTPKALNKIIDSYTPIFDRELINELREVAEAYTKKFFSDKVLRVYTKCLLKKKITWANNIRNKYMDIIMDNYLKSDLVAAFAISLAAADSDDYKCKVRLPGRGWCGLQRMAFTVGLCYGIDEIGCYEGRYCFHTFKDAAIALAAWDGAGDPSGNWIKHKGGSEYPNPNYKENERY